MGKKGGRGRKKDLKHANAKLTELLREYRHLLSMILLWISIEMLIGILDCLARSIS